VGWRTVRATLADGSKLQPEQPVLHLEIRMVCGYLADIRTDADIPATLGGQSGNLLQPKTPNSTDRNKVTQELAKNTMNSRLVSTSRIVH
jgi:hypothetical protein